MTVYYNDNDPKSARWLELLINKGLIAKGVVDNRSILDVTPSDLVGFTQCHFFAGIGGWSHALRLSGISDDQPLWTGSPPCQPFSVGGIHLGKDDERHLAPHFVKLVGACRPRLLFGEQVASAAVFGKASGKSKRNPKAPPEWAWIDDLSDRLEASHYAVGAGDFSAASVGAPHIRQRTFFGAVDQREAHGGLSNGDVPRSQGAKRCWATGEEGEPCGHTAKRSGVDGKYDSAAASQWGNSDWLLGEDGKWRAVEHGSCPLDDGVSGRVGILRGYGNAIVPQAASVFIDAFLESLTIGNLDPELSI